MAMLIEFLGWVLLIALLSGVVLWAITGDLLQLLMDQQRRSR